MRCVVLAIIAAMAFSAPLAAEAAAIRSGFDANTLPGNDDGSTGLVSIGFNVDFYGVSGDQLYVNNNGNVTFDSALETFTPFNLTSTSRKIIAPFFADIDTRGAIQDATYGVGTVGGRAAFGVNWLNVGYFNMHNDLLNDIQLVLIDRSDTGAGNFDFEFNYDRIEWNTGDASNGSGGFGGASARVGWSNGADRDFELAGSAVDRSFIDGGARALIRNRLNSDVNGRYVFQVRNGSVVPTPSEVPLPITAPLLLTALGGLVALRRRAESAYRDLGSRHEMRDPASSIRR